jgi:hypothetical protein
MAATKKKRSSVPSTNPKKAPAKRQSRRKVPTSQYTDVGQRKPASRQEVTATLAKPRKSAPPTATTRAEQVAHNELLAEPPFESTTLRNKNNETSVATAPDRHQQAAVAAAESIVKRHTVVPPLAVPNEVVAKNASIRPTKPSPQTHRLLAVACVVLLVAVVIGTTVWHRNRHQDSIASLVRQVSRVTVLPADETPVVSTVIDKQAVTQAFLANSQNGDKVLLYYHAKKAIVYRPSSHQVISIGPIAQGVARVFVRAAGASTTALQHTQTAIGDDTADFTVLSRDASAKTYPTTEVVDLTGVRPDVAAKLADLLHAKVVSLPAGESRPDGDMLVIVGQNG